MYIKLLCFHDICHKSKIKVVFIHNRSSLCHLLVIYHPFIHIVTQKILENVMPAVKDIVM